MKFRSFSSLKTAAVQVTDAHLSAFDVDSGAYGVAELLKWVVERALEPSLKERFTVSALVDALRCVHRGEDIRGYFERCACAPCEDAGGSTGESDGSGESDGGSESDDGDSVDEA